MIDSLEPYTLSQLEVMTIYGTAAFVLIILGPIAILWYQIRQAAQSQDSISHSLVTELSQAFFFILLFEIIVYAVFAMLIIASGSSPTNPALGVFGFFHIDWLNYSKMYESLKNLQGGPYSEEQMATARGAYLIMYAESMAFVFLMIGFFAMMINSLSGLFLSKHRMAQSSLQKDEEADIGIAFRWMFVAAVTGLVFATTLYILEGFIDAILQLAHRLGRTNFPGGNGPFDTDLLHQMLGVFRSSIKMISNVINP